MNNIIKKTIFLILVFFLAGGICVMSLPVLVRTDALQGYLLEQVEALLQHPVSVETMRLSYFPRPRLECRHLSFHPTHETTLKIQRAVFTPDLTTFFSGKEKPLSGKFTLNTLLLSGAQDPIDADDSTTLAGLQANLDLLDISIQGKSLGQFQLNGSLSQLTIDRTVSSSCPIRMPEARVTVRKTTNRLEFDLLPSQFSHPEIKLGIRYFRDTDTGQTGLRFTGQDVNAADLRETALCHLGGSRITRTLFHIIRAGTVPAVTVHFSGSKKHHLFDPEKMEIRGTLQQGTVAIPTTPLLSRSVSADVSVDNGTLSAKIDTAAVAGSILEKGRLDVALLNKKHPFNGLFHLNVDLAELPATLIALLPDSLPARELALTRNMSGTARGILKLNKNKGTLDVHATLNHFDARGMYQRFPGQAFHLTGKTLEVTPDIIRLMQTRGRVGFSRISDLSGHLDRSDPSMLTITSGSAVAPLEELIPRLKRLPSFVFLSDLPPPIEGMLEINRLTYSGPPDLSGISADSDVSSYSVSGRIRDARLGPDSGQNAAFQKLNFQFDMAPEHVILSNINANIQDPAPVLSLINGQIMPPGISALSKVPAMPLTLANGRLKQSGGRLSFRGDLTSPGGPVATVETRDGSQGFLLKEILFNDLPNTRCRLVFPPDFPASSMTLQGSLDLSSVKKVLSPDVLSLLPQSFTRLFDLSMTVAVNKGGLSLKTSPVLFNGKPSGDPVNLQAHTPTLSPSEAQQSPLFNNDISPQKDKEKSAQPRINKHLANQLIRFLPQPFTIDIDELQYGRWRFSPLILDMVRPAPNTLEIYPSLSVCSILINGKWTPLSPEGRLSLTIEETDGSFGPIVTCLTGKTGLIQGHFSLSAKLDASLSLLSKQKAETAISAIGGGAALSNRNENPVSNDYFSNAKGIFELLSPQGRIYQMTLLSRILSAINLTSLLKARLPDLTQKGFAYDRLLFKGKITGPRIDIVKGIIDGLDMTLLIRGWLDTASETMNLLIFVSPLKAVDSIIQKLPVINTLFQGDLVSIPITVTGSLQDPEITVLPPSEVSQGIVNAMKQILKTPFNLLKSPETRDEFQ